MRSTFASNAPATGASASTTRRVIVRHRLFRVASMNVTVFSPSAKSCASTASGQQTLTPAEFANRYGWQNDPSQVRLMRASDPLTPLDFSTTQLPNGDYVLAPAAGLIAGEQYVLEEELVARRVVEGRAAKVEQ